MRCRLEYILYIYLYVAVYDEAVVVVVFLDTHSTKRRKSPAAVGRTRGAQLFRFLPLLSLSFSPDSDSCRRLFHFFEFFSILAEPLFSPPSFPPLNQNGSIIISSAGIIIDERASTGSSRQSLSWPIDDVSERDDNELGRISCHVMRSIPSATAAAAAISILLKRRRRRRKKKRDGLVDTAMRLRTGERQVPDASKEMDDKASWTTATMSYTT